MSATPTVFHLFLPAPSDADAAIRAAERAPFSYAPVGGTRGDLPDGFDHDVQRTALGHGPQTWDRALAALRAWKQFELPWVRFYRPDTPIRPGEVVAFSSRQVGMWALNLCRIVEVRDESDGAVTRFAFAYGTLQGHVVSGEERFELTWDHATDEVSFEIRKFSRLQHWVVRTFRPVARHLQSKFSRDALATLRRAVEAP